jgi:hypothetical protein
MSAVKPAEIEASIRNLIAAEATNLGVEVSIPVAYPDGEMATVVIEPAGAGFIIHDSSFASMRLSASGISTGSKAIRSRLSELAARFKCRFDNGRVFIESDQAALPVNACLVANASRSVADYVFELRRHAESDFKIAVAERLREVLGDRVREGEEFRGKSGIRYRVSVLLNGDQSGPIHFIAALAHRQVVPKNFAMFYDLHGAYPHIANDAVYDESSDFRDEDRALLAPVSTVMGFMEVPLRFRQVLGHG